jgi:hypothetical protein
VFDVLSSIRAIWGSNGTRVVPNFLARRRRLRGAGCPTVRGGAVHHVAWSHSAYKLGSTTRLDAASRGTPVPPCHVPLRTHVCSRVTLESQLSPTVQHDQSHRLESVSLRSPPVSRLGSARPRGGLAGFARARARAVRHTRHNPSCPSITLERGNPILKLTNQSPNPKGWTIYLKVIGVCLRKHAKGSVESTHKVPTSHYHTKHCHAVVASLSGLIHRRGFSRIRPHPAFHSRLLTLRATLAAPVPIVTATERDAALQGDQEEGSADC